MVKPLGAEKNSIITFFVHPKFLSCFQGSVVERKYVKPYINKEKLVCVALKKEEPWQCTILERLKEIYGICSSQQYGYELDAILAWTTIWRSIVMNVPVKSPEVDVGVYCNYQKMKTILAYINEHYAEKITLEEIAVTVNLSRNECCRFFKRSASCTLFEYIMNYRISKGCEFLQDMDKSVKEVAYTVGFGDASYFITRFKEKTGYTPKEYRNMRRQGDNDYKVLSNGVLSAEVHSLA
jgi:AraC-like DNA-binding protein